MPNELTEIQVEEISLVNKAANRRQFLMRKSAEAKPEAETSVVAEPESSGLKISGVETTEVKKEMGSYCTVTISCGVNDFSNMAKLLSFAQELNNASLMAKSAPAKAEDAEAKARAERAAELAKLRKQATDILTDPDSGEAELAAATAIIRKLPRVEAPAA